jgi:hypothetical protein
MVVSSSTSTVSIKNEISVAVTFNGHTRTRARKARQGHAIMSPAHEGSPRAIATTVD